MLVILLERLQHVGRHPLTQIAAAQSQSINGRIALQPFKVRTRQKVIARTMRSIEAHVLNVGVVANALEESCERRRVVDYVFYGEVPAFSADARGGLAY